MATASRGEYCAIHTALPDESDFKALSPAAKLVFYTAKMLCGASGIEHVRRHREVLADLTGYTLEVVDAAREELRATRWIFTQGDVIWIRNGWRHNPNLSETNDNHRIGVEKHLRALPRLEIVNAFAAYYHRPESERAPLGRLWDGIGDAIPHPIGEQVHGTRNTEHGSGRGSDATHPAQGAVDEFDQAAETDLNALRGEGAALIREHFWLGTKPPRVQGQGEWSMSRDLSVWNELVKKGEAPEHVNGAIAAARTALRLPKDRPITMLVFRGDEGWPRFVQAKAAYLREQLRESTRRGGPQLARGVLDRAVNS